MTLLLHLTARALRPSWSIALAMILVLSACGGQATGTVPASSPNDESTSGSSLYDEVKERGVLRAGVRHDYPPLGFIGDDGEVTGLGPAIAREFAERLGVDIEFVQVTSENRIPLVQGGQVDFEIGATTPTVERDLVVDFTIPWQWDLNNVLVRADDGISTIEDLAPPRKAGAPRGSYYADLFTAEVPDGEMVLYDTFNDAVLALKAGHIDGVILSLTQAEAFVEENPDLMSGEVFSAIEASIGVRQDDSRWRDWLNFTLQQLWAEGIYQEHYEEFFGTSPSYTLWSELKLQSGIEDWDGTPSDD